MSIKKTQESVSTNPAWDLDDQFVRQKLRVFQQELIAIVKKDPETAGDEVSFWCLERGYYPKYIREGAYFTIERRPFGTKFFKKIQCTLTNANIESARDMYRALSKLLDRERYAKKKEHEEQLGGQECMGKPGTENRCLICYPKTIQEMMHEAGYVPPRKSEVAAAMKMPRAAAPVPPPNFEKPEALPVDPRVEIEENENICPKCGEPKTHCECVREEDLPF